jgi:hypothetical protein
MLTAASPAMAKTRNRPGHRHRGMQSHSSCDQGTGRNSPDPVPTGHALGVPYPTDTSGYDRSAMGRGDWPELAVRCPGWIGCRPRQCLPSS